MAKKLTAGKKRAIVISSVLVVLVIAGVLFSALKSDKKIEVETVKLQKETINKTLDTTGTVAAGSQGVFTLPSGVEVESVNVKEGDMVEAGMLIATFNTSSLTSSLEEKESAYKKAQEAYNNAVASKGQSGGKMSQLKAQIAELEKQVAELESKTQKEPSTAAAKPTAPSKPSVTVSDSLVKRFMRISKLFGVEYSEDMAKKILTGMLSAGSSTGDISSLLDNLGQISAASGSFDMSAFTGMSDSSALMTAKMNLVQLQAQLSMLELQSNDTYISAFKTIAEKTKEAYTAAKAQADSMKDGWKAEHRGIITEVNLGKQEDSAPSANVDISSILSAVTSGGDFTSMLTSFLSQDKAAVKILYYPLVADIALSKYDVLDVELNQDVLIKTANDNLINGKVSYISPVASSSSGINIGSIMGGSAVSATTIPAQITIDGADRSVIVGVDVNVSIITDTQENATVIPVEAVCIDGEEIFVYALEDGKAVKKPVELGISNDTYYQVLSGITVDDVLIKNTTGLADGVKVTVK